MSVQKVLEDYSEVSVMWSNNKICHKCKEEIQRGAPYLHLRRNRHVYIICGACIMFYAKKVEELDPSLTPSNVAPDFSTKADMTEKLMIAQAEDD